MSFDNHYPNRKDKRSNRVSCSRSCRTGGSCGWCRGNREYCNTKRKISAKEKVREFNRGE